MRCGSVEYLIKIELEFLFFTAFGLDMQIIDLSNSLRKKKKVFTSCICIIGSNFEGTQSSGRSSDNLCQTYKYKYLCFTILHEHVDSVRIRTCVSLLFLEMYTYIKRNFINDYGNN